MIRLVTEYAFYYSTHFFYKQLDFWPCPCDFWNSHPLGKSNSSTLKLKFFFLSNFWVLKSEILRNLNQFCLIYLVFLTFEPKIGSSQLRINLEPHIGYFDGNSRLNSKMGLIWLIPHATESWNLRCIWKEKVFTVLIWLYILHENTVS